MPFFIIAAQETGAFGAVGAFFTKGGIFMIPLVFCSLLSVTIIILRGIALRRGSVMPPVIEAEIERFTPGASSERLSRLVEGHISALARISLTALQHRKYPRSEAVEAVQTRARHEVVRLEAGMIVLEVIIGVAPLLGLLGTVSGLVSVFANLGSGAAESDPRGIALGISEALNTTIAGLAIAIPSLVAFSYFSKKIETMSVEMESLVADLLAKLYLAQREEPAGTSPAASSTLEPGVPLSRQTGFATGTRKNNLREPSSRRFETADPQIGSLRKGAADAPAEEAALPQDELPFRENSSSSAAEDGPSPSGER